MLLTKTFMTKFYLFNNLFCSTLTSISLFNSMSSCLGKKLNLSRNNFSSTLEQQSRYREIFSNKLYVQKAFRFGNFSPRLTTCILGCAEFQVALNVLPFLNLDQPWPTPNPALLIGAL